MRNKKILAIALLGLLVVVNMNGLCSSFKKDDVNLKNAVLDNEEIVIVAGFQGINEEEEITTLGRGGSDITAVALAAVLKAKECEIYTDVDGVYTADPRYVKNARKIKEISYEEMLELASLGAKVLHSRSVEFAKKYNLKIIGHTPWNLPISSPYKSVRAAALDEFIKCIEVFSKLKVNLVNAHPVVPNDVGDPNIVIKHNIDFFKKIVKKAKKHNIKIMMENTKAIFNELEILGKILDYTKPKRRWATKPTMVLG